MGTGTVVGPSAVITRYSRVMSWAVGSTWLTGGRRSAHSWPAESVTRNVRFERPPAINVNSSGALAPGTLPSNQAVTLGWSIPRGSIVLTLAPHHGAHPRSGPGTDPAEHRVWSPDMAEVTDATFEQAVLARSNEVPVVVDLWAPWCGPCKTLGPILERVIAETGGAVELAKVNVDENPRVSGTFSVQSIPAVYAMRDAKVVDGFVGALPEAQVREFVARLAPPPSEADQLVAQGDEASLRRALELEPGHAGAVVGLARILLDRSEPAAALELLARVPETPETRVLAAEARLAERHVVVDDVESLLDSLLERVRGDDEARQEFVDLLETLGADDPRRSRYRKALAARLF